MEFITPGNGEHEACSPHNIKVSEQCFNDALQSLVNTTHPPRPLCDIPLDELKKLGLKSGPKEILADK